MFWPLEQVSLNSKQDSRLEELMSSLLTRGLSLRIRATGRSMNPFICSGEVVILHRVPPIRLSIGDVILFTNHAGSLALHRIIHIRRNARNRGIDSGTIDIDPTGGINGIVNIDATVGADEKDRTGGSGGGDESVTPRNGWRIQTKGDASGLDPPISENNVLAKVVSVEKFTPFMGFRNLRLESPLWKLYGIAVVLAFLVKSSALGSFLRPFYRGAKSLRNHVFNLSRSRS
jgi:hypothetical protein